MLFRSDLLRERLVQRRISLDVTDAVPLPDTEFFVRKAIGWVLREVAPRHPREVSAWLRAHIDTISLVTLREPLRRLPDAAELRDLYDRRGQGRRRNSAG